MLLCKATYSAYRLYIVLSVCHTPQPAVVRAWMLRWVTAECLSLVTIVFEWFHNVLVWTLKELALHIYSVYGFQEIIPRIRNYTLGFKLHASYAHHGCICLIKIQKKTVIVWMKYHYNFKLLSILMYFKMQLIHVMAKLNFQLSW